MLELMPFTGMICGLILFNSIEWKGFTNKLLFSMFWFSLVSTLILGALSQFIGNVSIIIIILSIINFCSIIVFSFKIKFNSLNTKNKITTVILYSSIFIYLLLFLFNIWYIIGGKAKYILWRFVMENFTVLNDHEMQKITGGGLFEDAGKVAGHVGYWFSKGLAQMDSGTQTSKIIGKKKKKK